MPALLAAETPQPSSDLKRLRDAVTEFEIYRYTDPESYSSYLIPAHLRSVSGRGRFILIFSDRSGSMQLHRMDVGDGDMRQVTTFEGGIRLGAAALSHDDRTAYCLHGNVLQAVAMSGHGARPLYEAEDGAALEALAPDEGRTIILLERSGDSARVRQIGVTHKANSVLFEGRGKFGGLRARPSSGDVVLREGQRLVLVPASRGRAVELKTSADVRQAFWSASGKSLVYISLPADAGRRVQIREHWPESGEDRLVANTSQYVSFACNADASVFAGVSASKASPYILLLLRITRRELTIAEHRASEPAGVVVLFTPDSRRIFYHTDRAGRPAVYALPADKLVEPTDT